MTSLILYQAAAASSSAAAAGSSAVAKAALVTGTARSVRRTARVAMIDRRPIHASAVAQQESHDGDDPSSTFVRPGPPPLPPNEQREFERLVREKQNEPQFKPALRLNEDDERHPQYRAKPKAEFEGNTNPKTGEVGGPKNDPLRWENEWTYGGRSTDF